MRRLEPMKPQPQFLRIRWEVDTPKKAGAVTSGPLTASLARPGRSRRMPSNKPGIGALLQGARGDCGA